MLIKECKLKDLSSYGLTALVCYFAKTLVHGISDRHMDRFLVLLVRLIDKAKSEYNLARDYAIAEEKESKLTYKEIIDRGEGQPMYSPNIMNHFENCINAVARIYRIFEEIDHSYDHSFEENLRFVRNSVEHMEKQISKGYAGPVALSISEDALIVKITDKNGGIISLDLNNLASEIEVLYGDIRGIIDAC